MRISVFFSRSNSLVSRIITLITRGDASHAGILITNIPGADHELYQSLGNGFGMSTREELTRGSTRILKEIPIDVDPAKVLAICRARLGTPYAYLAVLGMLWVQLGKWLGQRWRNPVRSVHHQFCSEEVVEILAEAGFVELQGLDAVSVSPVALESILTRAGETLTRPSDFVNNP